MNSPCTLHHFFATLTVLLASTFIPAAAGQETPAPSSPAPGGCADSVISFSPCLPYISAPPNDLSDEPSSQCCDIFDGAFDADEADCLCYLVRQNSLLGFPLNVTKLLSLSDLCSVKNNSQANGTYNSLESICSGLNTFSFRLCFCSPALPPLTASTKKKPPSGSNARRPPSPSRPILHPPPVAPSTITRPRPPPISTQITIKPSTSDLELTNAAYIWCFLFEFLYFRI
ncbi:hypothetical protein SSX86_025912 [Deinandra increscens subsp. villosa]|uniref:Bifunctional inhibitor/plant lipid transfer protein/seed storage helical domain-containing protein n=1 Tax=Deinandra increscens subsp. villosa TaxID=3103831 RepID=A0AAP0CK58_9ASTR